LQRIRRRCGQGDCQAKELDHVKTNRRLPERQHERNYKMEMESAVRNLTISAALSAVIGLGGCATGPGRTPGDPLEPMNRAIFSFNEGLDKYVARPAAVGYTKVTPSPVRAAVSNFFSNIGDIGNFANDLLQLKITDATEDLVRFAFNSAFGIGGLIDWASPAGLPKPHQDLSRVAPVRAEFVPGRDQLGIRVLPDSDVLSVCGGKCAAVRVGFRQYAGGPPRRDRYSVAGGVG
jgi:hypothetical protein